MTRLAVDEFSYTPAQNGTNIENYPEAIQQHIPYDPNVVASTLAFTIGLCHVSLT